MQLASTQAASQVQKSSNNRCNTDEKSPGQTQTRLPASLTTAWAGAPSLTTYKTLVGARRGVTPNTESLSAPELITHTGTRMSRESRVTGKTTVKPRTMEHVGDS